MSEVTFDGGQGGEQQQAAAPSEPSGGAGGLDLGPLQDQVSKLGETFEQRLGEFEQRLPAPEDQYQRNDLGQFAGVPPEQQPFAGQPYGQQPGVPGQQQPQYDEYGELTPEAAQAQLQQMLNPMLQPLQQQLAAQAQQNQQLQQMMQELEMDRGAERLEQTYPELQDTEKANALVAHASEVASQIGSPDLVGRTGFLELVHKAQRADAAAANETAATPGPALEPAGGGSLAGTEDTPQQRIKAAGVTNPIWGVTR